MKLRDLPLATDIAPGEAVKLNATGTDVEGYTPGAPGPHAATHENGGSDEISVAGLSGLLADPQTPLAHAASHKSGGADAIKLDELAAPTDVTTLNASTSAHGLLPKLSGNSSDVLRGDGTWGPGGGGADGEVSLYKSADQSISAAGWVDISGMTFPVVANGAYLIEAYILFQTSTTAMGVWFGFNGPASPRLAHLVFSKEITAVATAGTDKFSEVGGTAYDTAYPTAATSEIAQATNLLLKIRGVFVNGPNAGTFALRLNKENVSGTATVKEGSWLRYRKLN